jgi:hypothetical protein
MSLQRLDPFLEGVQPRRCRTSSPNSRNVLDVGDGLVPSVLFFCLQLGNSRERVGVLPPQRRHVGPSFVGIHGTLLEDLGTVPIPPRARRGFRGIDELLRTFRRVEGLGGLGQGLLAGVLDVPPSFLVLVLEELFAILHPVLSPPHLVPQVPQQRVVLFSTSDGRVDLSFAICSLVRGFTTKRGVATQYSE